MVKSSWKRIRDTLTLSGVRSTLWIVMSGVVEVGRGLRRMTLPGVPEEGSRSWRFKRSLAESISRGTGVGGEGIGGSLENGSRSTLILGSSRQPPTRLELSCNLQSLSSLKRSPSGMLLAALRLPFLRSFLWVGESPNARDSGRSGRSSSPGKPGMAARGFAFFPRFDQDFRAESEG